MRSSSTSETPISADAALVIDRLQWTVYCWIGLGWVEIIDLFERRFKWPKKPPYSCCDKGHRSDWRGRDCPQRGAAGLAAAAQLRKGVHPKVQLPPCRGGKVVTTSSFALPTNPTEQFNNFKKYLPAYPSLVKYLFGLNDISSSDFSKYDDPMTVSTNIIN